MATKSNAKKIVKKAKPPTQSTIKPAAKKPVAKKVTKPVLAKKATPTKTAAKKAPIKAPAPVKASSKTTASLAVKKSVSQQSVAHSVAKKPAPALASKIAAKPVERKEFDRAPTEAQKAPMNVVARQSYGKAMAATYAPQPSGRKANFIVGEYVVYPTHGVGKIMGHESEKIGDYELKVFVIAFEKDKMTLRVPVGRAEAAGLRSISTNDQITKALSTLKGRAKIARGMWSRRAQEYEAKINSGNLVAIAEVVRDLHKNVDQSERSYSERMIYETALHRLSGEVAASEKVDVKAAQDKLLVVLRKQAAMAA